MNANRPLPAGSVISWKNATATVIFDSGGERISVKSETGREESWYWEFDSVVCQVISVPQQKNKIEEKKMKSRFFSINSQITYSYPDGFGSEANYDAEDIELQIRNAIKAIVEKKNKENLTCKYHEAIKFDVKFD